MIGDVFPSEMRVITDEKTGNPVVQLTQKGINFHMYFTDNAFDLGNDRLHIPQELRIRSRGTERHSASN